MFPRSPSVATGGRGIHLVFSAGLSGAREVLYTQSLDDGSTWTPVQALFSQAGTEYLEIQGTARALVVADIDGNGAPDYAIAGVPLQVVFR